MKTMICSICGKPYTDNIASDATEIVCAICAMRMADNWEREKRGLIKKPNKSMVLDLLDAIKRRKLASFRKKYGFLQADLSHFLGISERQVRKYENSQRISIDRLYKKAQNITQKFR